MRQLQVFTGSRKELRIIIPELQKLGVKIRLAADSGYENYKIFDYLEKMKVGFVIAQKQRKKVKTAGKKKIFNIVSSSFKRFNTIFK